jgi:hypothetical protein
LGLQIGESARDLVSESRKKKREIEKRKDKEIEQDNLATRKPGISTTTHKLHTICSTDTFTLQIHPWKTKKKSSTKRSNGEITENYRPENIATG